MEVAYERHRSLSISDAPTTSAAMRASPLLPPGSGPYNPASPAGSFGAARTRSRSASFSTYCPPPIVVPSNNSSDPAFPGSTSPSPSGYPGPAFPGSSCSPSPQDFGLSSCENSPAFPGHSPSEFFQARTVVRSPNQELVRQRAAESADMDSQWEMPPSPAARTPCTCRRNPCACAILSKRASRAGPPLSTSGWGRRLRRSLSGGTSAGNSDSEGGAEPRRSRSLLLRPSKTIANGNATSDTEDMGYGSSTGGESGRSTTGRRAQFARLFTRTGTAPPRPSASNGFHSGSLEGIFSPNHAAPCAAANHVSPPAASRGFVARCASVDAAAAGMFGGSNGGSSNAERPGRPSSATSQKSGSWSSTGGSAAARNALPSGASDGSGRDGSSGGIRAANNNGINNNGVSPTPATTPTNRVGGTGVTGRGSGVTDGEARVGGNGSYASSSGSTGGGSGMGGRNAPAFGETGGRGAAGLGAVGSGAPVRHARSRSFVERSGNDVARMAALAAAAGGVAGGGGNGRGAGGGGIVARAFPCAPLGMLATTAWAALLLLPPTPPLALLLPTLQPTLQPLQPDWFQKARAILSLVRECRPACWLGSLSRFARSRFSRFSPHPLPAPPARTRFRQFNLRPLPAPQARSPLPLTPLAPPLPSPLALLPLSPLAHSLLPPSPLAPLLLFPLVRSLLPLFPLDLLALPLSPPRSYATPLSPRSFATPLSPRSSAPLSPRASAPLSPRASAPLSPRTSAPLSPRSSAPLSPRFPATRSSIPRSNTTTRTPFPPSAASGFKAPAAPDQSRARNAPAPRRHVRSASVAEVTCT
ncbi:unnamed protein product [Closterium sp. NIES-64]|nr:unnamed protein product [Closterium sp. NIES-64]